MNKTDEFRITILSIYAFLKEATMLGKVRSIALAVMAVGLWGVGAHVGTVVSSTMNLPASDTWDTGFVVNRGGELVVQTASASDTITLKTGDNGNENGSVYVNGGTITVQNGGTLRLTNTNPRLATLVW